MLQFTVSIATACALTSEFTLAAAHREELYLIVSTFQFLLETLYRSLLLHNLFQLRVHIDRWRIADFSSPSSVVKRRDVLFCVEIDWGKARDHQSEAVATQALLQYGC